ncbi:TerD family protein [Streptomyces sp. NPDC002055]|uniref:TerD family protein n=1 Tax=Streptomyces sp. NPDC002055 TaxID=3154534 RepID=UPI003318945E
MTAELVRGQNHPLPGNRVEIRVSAGSPVVAGATLGDEQGTVRGTAWVAHPAAPALPGLEVSRQAAAVHRLAVDLDVLPGEVHRVHVLLALPGGGGGPARFGAVAAPFVAVTGLDGSEIAGYTVTDLDSESAVVAVELYRRQGAWKVRAVGQGYAGGLAALFRDQGLPQAGELAATIQDAVAQGMARSVPAPSRTAEGDRVRTAPSGTGAGAGTAPGTAADRAHNGPADGGGGGTRGTGSSLSPGTDPAPFSSPSASGPSSAPVASPSAPGPSSAPVASPSAPAPSSAPAASPSAPSPLPAASAPGPSVAPSGASVPATGEGGGPVDYRHPRRAAAPSAAPPSPADGAGGPASPSSPAAGDATGWTLDERLYNQVWGMFEDLARTVAAYRSAVDFADSRREQELDRLLADPRLRLAATGDSPHAEAHAKHTRLVEQAQAALDRDLAQLVAEAEVVEPALPPAFARWDNPVWQTYRVPMEIPMALRLGDLHLPESPDLRIPMLVRLPLERGLWVDRGRASTPDSAFLDPGELRRLAMDTAVAHAARLLAVYPAGEFTVQVIDPAGAAASSLAPLVRSGALREPPAAGAAGVAAVLAGLTQRVDLVQMALRGGASDALPPDVDTSQRLLIVNDFPHGFDDRDVTRLRYLADEGPAVGVHLMLVADREDAQEYGPLLDPLWRSLMRITPIPDDHLADPWVGHAWTYEPPLAPPGSAVLEQVLVQVAEARRRYGR